MDGTVGGTSPPHRQMDGERNSDNDAGPMEGNRHYILPHWLIQYHPRQTISARHYKGQPTSLSRATGTIEINRLHYREQPTALSCCAWNYRGPLSRTAPTFRGTNYLKLVWDDFSLRLVKGSINTPFRCCTVHSVHLYPTLIPSDFRRNGRAIQKEGSSYLVRRTAFSKFHNFIFGLVPGTWYVFSWEKK